MIGRHQGFIPDVDSWEPLLGTAAALTGQVAFMSYDAGDTDWPNGTSSLAYAWRRRPTT